MVPASARDGGSGDTTAERGETSLTTLARDLVETVGVEGAIRYCSSVGWRGVREEVELLRGQNAPAE